MSCKSELLWQSEVWCKFGIKKKYEETWEKTATMLSEANMIDMEKKWVNGKTYREIMKKMFDAKINGVSGFKSMVIENMRKIMGKKFSKFVSYIFDEKSILSIYQPEDFEKSKKTTKDLQNILTRELAVVAGVIKIHSREYSQLPGSADPSVYARNMHISSRTALGLFDWDIYVIDFSSLSKDDMLEQDYLFSSGMYAPV